MPLFPEVSYLGNELIIDIICFSLEIIREKLSNVIRRTLLHEKNSTLIFCFKCFKYVVLARECVRNPISISFTAFLTYQH